jgi:hypothetical protein
MGNLARAANDLYKTYKDYQNIKNTAKATTDLVQAYVDNNSKQQQIAFTQIEAWMVYFSFFPKEMEKIKPSTLKYEHRKMAERLLIDAISAYHQLNILQELWQKASNPASSLAPLGVANLVMKMMRVYLGLNSIPSQSEINEFDQKGGLVRVQIISRKRLYLADLIVDNM